MVTAYCRCYGIFPSPDLKADSQWKILFLIYIFMEIPTERYKTRPYTDTQIYIYIAYLEFIKNDRRELNLAHGEAMPTTWYLPEMWPPLLLRQAETRTLLLDHRCSSEQPRDPVVLRILSRPKESAVLTSPHALPVLPVCGPPVSSKVPGLPAEAHITFFPCSPHHASSVSGALATEDRTWCSAFRLEISKATTFVFYSIQPLPIYHQSTLRACKN